MKDSFGMTKEEFAKWLTDKSEHEPECGVYAISPEAYEELMSKTWQHFQEEFTNGD